jgi:hypothetical protein
MKEEYKRFISNEESWALGCGGGLALALIPLIIALAVKAGAVAMLVFIILTFVIICLSVAPPSASFDADDTQVTFSYLGKKITISYDDIKELKLEHRHNERNVKGGVQRCYVETLTIKTTEKVYSFSAEMDIDYDEVAKDPACMTEQFENGKLSHLKTYIEKHIYINI